MQGAARRMQRERELVWFGAMLPHFKQPIPLDKFVGGPVDDTARVRDFHDAWDRVDRALARHRPLLRKDGSES